MRRLVNISFGYAIAAMIGGVFYREFTKFNGYSDRTTLGFLHTHLFLLGMIMFLFVALFRSKYQLEQSKKFKVFMITYNVGVPLTTIMLVVRGIVQVLNIPVSKAMSASISGIAGIAHGITGIGIIFLFLSLREFIKE